LCSRRGVAGDAQNRQPYDYVLICEIRDLFLLCVHLLGTSSLSHWTYAGLEIPHVTRDAALVTQSEQSYSTRNPIRKSVKSAKSVVQFPLRLPSHFSQRHRQIFAQIFHILYADRESYQGVVDSQGDSLLGWH
jgi:hypothetical protein